jgi:hypothetical protein
MIIDHIYATIQRAARYLRDTGPRHVGEVHQLETWQFKGSAYTLGEWHLE